MAIFSLFATSLAFANPLASLIQAEKPSHAPRNASLSEPALNTQNYTDFTGEWSGACQTNDDENPGAETGAEKRQPDKHKQSSINIKNNQDWIQVCIKNKCSDYEIGKDVSQYQEMQGGAFFAEHLLLNWSNDARLLINTIDIYSDTFDNNERSVFSMLGRSIFSLKEDKLTIQHEIHEFEDAEDATQNKFVCELKRQPTA